MPKRILDRHDAEPGASLEMMRDAPALDVRVRAAVATEPDVRRIALRQHPDSVGTERGSAADGPSVGSRRQHCRVEVVTGEDPRADPMDPAGAHRAGQRGAGDSESPEVAAAGDASETVKGRDGIEHSPILRPPVSRRGPKGVMGTSRGVRGSVEEESPARSGAAGSPDPGIPSCRRNVVVHPGQEPRRTETGTETDGVGIGDGRRTGSENGTGPETTDAAGTEVLAASVSGGDQPGWVIDRRSSFSSSCSSVSSPRST